MLRHRAKMAPYVNKTLGIVEPHTYAMAEEAYKTLLKTGSSQALVVSGESGAGKTETNKHLMTYLPFRSKSETRGQRPCRAILAGQPGARGLWQREDVAQQQLVALRQVRQDLPFGEGGVLGAVTKQYLLEKSRVPSSPRASATTTSSIRSSPATRTRPPLASTKAPPRSTTSTSRARPRSRASTTASSSTAVAGDDRHRPSGARTRTASATCSRRCCTSATSSSAARTTRRSTAARADRWRRRPSCCR